MTSSVRHSVRSQLFFMLLTLTCLFAVLRLLSTSPLTVTQVSAQFDDYCDYCDPDFDDDCYYECYYCYECDLEFDQDCYDYCGFGDDFSDFSVSSTSTSSADPFSNNRRLAVAGGADRYDDQYSNQFLNRYQGERRDGYDFGHRQGHGNNGRYEYGRGNRHGQSQCSRSQDYPTLYETQDASRGASVVEAQQYGTAGGDGGSGSSRGRMHPQRRQRRQRQQNFDIINKNYGNQALLEDQRAMIGGRGATGAQPTAGASGAGGQMGGGMSGNRRRSIFNRNYGNQALLDDRTTGVLGSAGAGTGQGAAGRGAQGEDGSDVGNDRIDNRNYGNQAILYEEARRQATAEGAVRPPGADAGGGAARPRPQTTRQRTTGVGSGAGGIH